MIEVLVNAQDEQTGLGETFPPYKTSEAPMARTLIEPHEGDKRYVRRKKGRFTKKQVAVGRSLAADRRSKSRTIAKKGEGDRGDQKRRKTKRKTARKTKRKRR